ncbi:T9SS type A sorting domain-containing protein [Chryseobacterium sp. Ch-15]|uniref:T9SS type A sorting domain-containing protein n=1 Tax=Chryseobacterium muglaense TaxID=2893752 RepID=A0A9Q3URR9_9FLAO|nr:T9SS type A sorting domain-containing protein [Chryseobacterium muglaense]MBD3905294.1 T9SS type A sorting domain-containing protein [Chryseobacterium muglaense]MCC9033949.1 T9SS type A sorting domain-containing protein [Chryseobacterium muglaense]MCM2554168.1 T9SS type A sorting domain-containing protein [Chryseobacterium muglaense]
MKKVLFIGLMALATMSSAQISYNYGWEPTGEGSWTSSGDSGWYGRSETTPCTGVGSMVANNYYNESSYLISPALTGSNGGDINVSFAYKVTEYSSNSTGASLADFGVIKLEWATSETGPWTTAYTIDDTSHVVSASCITKSATISGVPSSGDFFIRFEAKSALDTSDNYVYFDDITITQGAAPSCLDPSSVTVSNITSATADIAWNAPTVVPGSGYELYYSTNAAFPTSTTPPTYTGITGVSKMLSGLSPNTQYYAWVRSSCTATTKSAWSTASSFMTLCGVITPNFTFDFTGGINDCWEEADAGTPASTPSGTSSYWYETGFLNNGFEGAFAINLYTSSWLPETFDAWLITPVFNLSAGGYRVKFDYGLTEYGDTISGSLGSDDVVQFVVSQDGGTTWTVLQTWNAASNVSNSSTTYSYDLATYNGANTKFGFYATNGTVEDPEDVEFFIDNLVVEQISLSTNESNFAKNTIKAYPNPFADVLNISDLSNVKSISVMDISGRVVKTFNKPETTLHLGGLNAGMYLVVLNMKDGSKQTIKTIKK